jgi:hypothetical protein
MARAFAPRDITIPRRPGNRSTAIVGRSWLARVGPSATAPVLSLSLGMFVFVKANAYFADAFISAILAALVLMTALPLMIPVRRRPGPGGAMR